MALPIQTQLPKKPIQPAPPIEKLKLMLLNNLVDPVKELIEKHYKDRFIVVALDGGVFEIRSALTQGEQYLEKFITLDPETIEMKQRVAQAAHSSYDVLICGETGTGKEMLAKAQVWDRKGSVKSVNCAGFPEDLFESEVFGYVEGAFTGAKKTTEGLITLATGGVMFFDEIGDLPLHQQAKLLRVMQEKVLRKVGGKQEERVDCKFVFATHQPLKKMVTDGSFRKDFYARISALEVQVKPLKDRACDIEPIVKSMGVAGENFWKEHADDIELLDLSMNVRSIQQYVIRHSVWGKLTLKKI